MLKDYTDDWGKEQRSKTFHFNQNKSFHLSRIKNFAEYFLPSKVELFQPHIPHKRQGRAGSTHIAHSLHCLIDHNYSAHYWAHDKLFQLQPWVIGLSLISFIHAEFPWRSGIWHFSIPPCAHLKYGSLYWRKWALLSVSELPKEVLAMDQAITHTAQYSGYVLYSKGRMNIQTDVSCELRIIFHRQ